MTTAAPLSPFRVVATICGMLFVVIGTIAITTGEFQDAAIWVVVAGLATSGLAGLVVLTTSNQQQS